MFPAANFTDKLAIIKAAFKSAPEHLPEPAIIEQTSAPLVDVPLADSDWQKFRPLSRVRKSSRPPEILPELWNHASPKQKKDMLEKIAQNAAKVRVAELQDPVIPPDSVPYPTFQEGGSSSSSSSGPNVSAATASHHFKGNPKKMVFFEFCCDDDSNLYESAKQQGMAAERFSLSVCDLSTKSGIAFVMDMAKQYTSLGFTIHMHSAVPCTVWSAWQHFNIAKGSASFRRNMLRRRAESATIIAGWKEVARYVKSVNGHNSFEWPRYCSGWFLVQDFFEEMGMKQSKPDGCMLGSISTSGDYIKKPWSWWSSFEPTITMLETRVCDGTHNHVPCQGSSTKPSGHYPRRMTDDIIDTIVNPQKYVPLNQQPTEALVSGVSSKDVVASDELPGSQHLLGLESGESIKNITKTLTELAKVLRTSTYVSNNVSRSAKKALQPHREKFDNTTQCQFSPVYALVHKLLTKADPEFHSEGAAASLNKELTKLKSIKVWDHDSPREWSDVRKEDLLATIARLFPITSLKHAETKCPEFKSRIVLQGSNVKDTDGNAALFGEISSNPSNLNTIRHGAVYSGTNDKLRCDISDAVAAYIQHLLTEADGPSVYVRLPREWLPESAKNMRDPCFKMLRPVYGHPAAGRIWETHLREILLGEEYLGIDGKPYHWEPVPSFPNTWVLDRPQMLTSFLTVYVDDFVLVGQDNDAVWKQLRLKVELTDPLPISRALGCNFKISKDPEQPTVTIIEQEMRDFFASCVEKYTSTPGTLPIKFAEVPFLESVDPDDDTSPPGVLKEFAAALLMKPFYGARACRPELIYTITFLARYVTVWSAVHDKMIHRLYNYIASTLDMVLVAKVDSRDFNTLELDAYPDADFAGCKRTSRSTSGGWFELGAGSPTGLTTAGLEWSSKRQTATATSTTEAEMSSAAAILKGAAVPALELWERLLRRPVTIRLLEDNQATLKVMQSGYSSKLRHMSKTQRVELSFVTDVCKICGVKPEYIQTHLQKGDFLTKGLSREKHCKALDLVGLKCQNCSA